MGVVIKSSGSPKPQRPEMTCRLAHQELHSNALHVLTRSTAKACFMCSADCAGVRVPARVHPWNDARQRRILNPVHHVDQRLGFQCLNCGNRSPPPKRQIRAPQLHP